MRRFIPTPSMTVAVVALVFAASGSAYAAKELINGKEIRNGTISAAKLSRAAKQQLKGAAGARGPAGPAGPAGATGAAGPKGDAGAQGAQGPQGPRGDQGARGAQGPEGPQGPAGGPGAAGAAGAAGRDGMSVLFRDKRTFYLPDDRRIDFDANFANYTGGRLQRRLVLPRGAYRVEANMSVRPPAAPTADGRTLVSRTRCNLVNATTATNIDTYYVTFFNGDLEVGDGPGYREGLSIGGIVDVPDGEATVEVRCYGFEGPAAAGAPDAGQIAAASLEAWKLTELNDQTQP